MVLGQLMTDGILIGANASAQVLALAKVIPCASAIPKTSCMWPKMCSRGQMRSTLSGD
jgi:hypothetical protein